MATESVIRCQGVIRRFGEKVALSGIDLEVRRGETMVIMGGSGCGKSTLLKMLIGGSPPDGGTVHLFGQDPYAVPEEELNAIRRRFGILFQSGALFNSMTVAENVALPLREHTDLDPNIIDIQVMLKLNQVGLREHAQKMPGQLSGGMKKRAGLARALALDPELLFYDEPSAGLDPVTSAQIDQLIVGLSRELGVTSVVVTHEMDSAFTIADRMAMIDKGKVLKIESRDWFDRLRKTTEQEAEALSDDERLMRQFLRGDPEGPFAARREAKTLEEDLLGITGASVHIPSIEATRSGVMKRAAI
jgi:phospholipid/cholesterol/gamma-HCH transport system ATP-binding protein